MSADDVEHAYEQLFLLHVREAGLIVEEQQCHLFPGVPSVVRFVEIERGVHFARPRVVHVMHQVHTRVNVNRDPLYQSEEEGTPVFGAVCVSNAMS